MLPQGLQNHTNLQHKFAFMGSSKVAHSPIVNINCHIAILFKMCSECTNQYPRRRKKKNQHQQGGGGEETLVLQEDDQLLTMQLPLSL